MLVLVVWASVLLFGRSSSSQLGTQTKDLAGGGWGGVGCEELSPTIWWSLPSVTRVSKKQTGVLFKPLEFEVFYFDHLNLFLTDPGHMT